MKATYEKEKIPVGSGFDYFGNEAPENYMFADGSEISRTDYAELFEVIGTLYGSGNDSTTFNLPDKRERVSVMYKSDSDTFNKLGQITGEKKHKLTVSEMPKHNHNSYMWAITPDGKGNRDVAYTGTGQATQIVTNGTGGDEYHNNIQPSLVCNYIIKVK